MPTPHAHDDVDDDNDHHRVNLHCDKHAAREARQVVEKVVTKIAGSFGAELASTCPLHPSNDHVLPHEQQKKPVTQWQWRCGVCGKLFKAEHYLDRHLDRKHADLLNATAASTCLGEYCDILQCPSWVDGVRRQERERPRPCKAGELEARKHLCQHLMHDCFLAAPHGGHSADLHPIFEAMEQHFCAPISCAGRSRLVAGGASAATLPYRYGGDASGADGGGGGGGTGYNVMAVLLLGGLALLYAGLFCWWSETRTGSGELRARRSRQRNSFLGSFTKRSHRD